MRQAAFSFLKDYKKEFGGSLLQGKRKSKRPLSTKHPLHLVLKSCLKGVFNPGNKSLKELIRSQCHQFGIKIYDLALNWSHIHLVIKIQDRKDYLKLIRSLTSILAGRIRRAKKDLINEDIFTLRPFTRILTWGRDFKNALEYQVLNQLEAWGLIKREKKFKKVTGTHKESIKKFSWRTKRITKLCSG